MYLDFLAAEGELYQRMLAPVEKKYNLTSMELAIVLFLANNPNYDTATEIVNIRHLTKSHVSTSVKSLEEKGLLCKAYRDGDHRTVHLSLLEQSDEIVAAGRKVQNEFYSVLRKGFSEEENETMTRYFQRMSENINTALGKEKSENESK